MRKILISIAASLSFIMSQAQLSIKSTSDAEIMVCQDPGQYKIVAVNNSSSTVSGVEIAVDLPLGIAYVMNSFSEETGKNLLQKNTSNLNIPTFRCNNIEIGDSLVFMIKVRALMESVDHQEAGNVFRNKVALSYDGGSANHTSAAYNILFPALNIININPTSKTVISGENVTRTIKIVNAGYGKTDQISLHRNNSIAGTLLINSSHGTIENNGALINISGVDFSLLGNGDNFFDSGETIELTETILASGCDANTVTTTYNASWGCLETSTSTENSYAHFTIALKTPSLTVNTTNQMSECFGSENASQTMTIKNIGAGVARNIIVDIFKSSGNYVYDQSIYSSLTNFSYALNGATPISFSPSTTGTLSNDSYSCLGANPVGEANYTLPFDLQPNDVFIISWETQQCCISECENQGNMGWQYTVDYEDFCQTASYTKKGTGEEPTILNMNLFTETPADIRDGETLPFNYTISSHDNNLPQGEGAHYKLFFQLPAGLSWSGESSDLIFHKDNTVWNASSINYDQEAGTITAQYPLPEPFLYEKSEIQLNLTGDCASDIVSSGIKEIALDIFYVSSTICQTTCNVKMVCSSIVTTDLHCPIGNCNGVHFYGFDISRTSYGISDNDLNGKPDAESSLDFDKVKTNRVMVGDTFKTIHKGIVHTTNPSLSFNNMYASSSIALGTNLNPVKTVAHIYNHSTSTEIITNEVLMSYSDNGSQRTFRYSLIPNETSDLKDYSFTDGDSIKFEAFYKVTGNIGGQVQEVKATNELFLSDSKDEWTSPTTNRAGCDSYNGRFTLVGYYFSNHTSTRYNITQCTKTIKQDFAMSIGDCCDNYEGGNLFPYEYRNWAHINKVRVSIPPHYEVLNQYVTYRSTKATNSHLSHTVQGIEPEHNSGGVMVFDLAQYYAASGGEIIYSDDGFSGTVYLELAPTCDVPENTYQDVNWEFEFVKNTFIGGGETGWIGANPDQIKFSPTEILLNSSNPIVDGIGRTVTWNLKVINSTNKTDASNAWIHFKNPSKEVSILSVSDSEGNIIPMTGDIYQIGLVKRNNTNQFNITATYTGCAPDYIVVYSGYECAGYPDLFKNFRCNYSTYSLKVEPKEAGMQARISGKTIGDACGREVEVTVELASVKSGHLDNISIDILSNSNSASFISNSGALKYPIKDSFATIDNPEATSIKYSYGIMSINSQINDEGLPGVLDIANNKFQLRFRMNLDDDFQSGDFIQLSLNSQEICGNTIPEINLAYDPSIALSQNTTSGLTDLSGSTWGIAWVDYNNDGFDDVFISEYEINKPNVLYLNNQDGTFSQVASNAIVDDLTNTVSSTWADYDNDGDMDAFLANNVRGVNKLFTNNGNGDFSKGVEGDINNDGGYCHNASWVDYDNDGHLDLFVTDYFETKYNLLYHNNGDGSFEKIENEPIANHALPSIGATWADYDNDGDMDVFIPNTKGVNNSLYQNTGNGTFALITTGMITNDGGNSVGSSWGDYNNDGYQDLFVANTGGQHNFLYQNNKDGSFTKINTGVVVEDNHNSSGSSWIDIDNDGDLDLFVTNDLGDPSCLYTNNSDGSFSKHENALNAVLGNAYPNAWSDYDNDGDMDVLIGNRDNEKNVFFTNEKANCNSHLCINLTGTNSNRDGIGSKIRVKATINGKSIWQMREVTAQSGGGAGSQNSMKALFGLGNASIVDSVIVEWPSGFKQYFTNRSVNDCLDIVEEQGNLVCGKAYYDSNENCSYDIGEQLLPNKMIEILPGGKIFSTNANGDYKVYLSNGDYTLRPMTEENWTVTCGDNIPVTIDNTDQCDINFGFTSSCNASDLSVQTGMTALRRGFRNQISLIYNNQSAHMAEDVILTLEVDNDIVLMDASIPWNEVIDNASTKTYYWNISSISAHSSTNILITDSVSRLSEIDKEIIVKSSLVYNADCDVNNNQYIEEAKIVGSVDPNDILVYPGGKSIYVDETLHYTIRFQNVGTYYASRVIVIDSLPKNMDLSTFKVEGQSHDFKYNINGSVIRWEVNNIYLPDSIANEAESHGFIKFSIKANKNTSHGTQLNNRAFIQFDYNEFISTNIVSTEIIQDYGLRQQGMQAIIYPNPVNDLVSMHILSADKKAYLYITKIQIRDVSGKLLFTNKVERSMTSGMSMSGFSSGIYQVTLTDHLERSITTRVIKM